MSFPARVIAVAAVLAVGAVVAPAASADPLFDQPRPLSEVSPLVAAIVNDLPIAQVRQMARSDHFQVDEHGRIRSVEKHAAPTGKTARSSLAVPPGTDVFKLHSRPGSNRTIYLDFNGHTVQGTAWNGGALINAPAWDADGDPSTFNAAERDTIYQAFLSVTEDYKTFDVDVTTEEPTDDRLDRADTNDQVYGARAVITPTDVTNCGCGGQAYIGTFNQAGNHAKYQPAWAYANGSYDGKSIGEIVAHETGHNLGLSHDGQTGGVEYYGGHTNWAPIMGAGYGQPVTTWSKGEYTNANNKEDDLAVIPQHGAVTLPDDYPDDPANAAPLTAGTPVNGLITTDADVDVFAIDHPGGTLKAAAVPAEFAPDLDIKMTIRDASGTIVATVDPPVHRVSETKADGLDAHFAQNLPAGRYTIQVEGTGYGDPGKDGYTGYASIGDYTLTAE
ncbi:zinc-dependent metalloprotease family protein [Actinocrispum wychmicini]|uniref:Reprolysin-like metallo-peptidase family M12B n=1 Tax=Actinocrispum wychmicini TaxID=1213861 RepID=A0A4R2K0F7_9PSEU|nr:zinc-dependent metalloprotease family protein [Actinocrispum wychmicini]TCO65092.1 reprolysin-like metallo-peptidase family M12B [Actinocrispum wychmicini]